MDLALNNLQRLICHETHQTNLNHHVTVLWSIVPIPVMQQMFIFSSSGCLMSCTGHSFGRWGVILPLCWDAVSVFYSPSQQAKIYLYSVTWFQIFLSYFNNLYGYSYLIQILYIQLYDFKQPIGLVDGVFTNCLGDPYSIPGLGISKDSKNGTWSCLA